MVRDLKSDQGLLAELEVDPLLLEDRKGLLPELL